MQERAAQILSILVCGIFLAASATVSAKDVSHPNIVLIVLDDLDWFDVGINGSQDVLTPHIDKLAREGVALPSFYSMGAVCSPSRTAMLTGNYPTRYGVKRTIAPTSRRGIPVTAPSRVSDFARAGYRTAHVGKWHLGSSRPEFLPLAKGFDSAVRLDASSYSYYDYDLIFDEARKENYVGGPYLTNHLTDHAVRYIEQLSKQEEPFFLNLWYLAPHKPLEPPPGFETGESDHCRLRTEASLECAEAREKLATMVQNVDRQIGRVLAALEKAGVSQSTIVAVTSDNGGARPTSNSKVVPNRPLRGVKGEHFEGGVRVPLVLRWPERLPAGTVASPVATNMGLLITLAELASVEVAEVADGMSFASALMGGRSLARSQPLYWENKISAQQLDNASGYYNRFAVRRGSWKYLFEPSYSKEEPDAHYLFDLSADPKETSNLLGTRGTRFAVPLTGYELALATAPSPERRRFERVAESMRAGYFAWRRQTALLPSQAPTDPSETVFPKEARLDFDDGDFSFFIGLSADQGTDWKVAFDPVWSIALEGGAISLEIAGAENAALRLAIDADQPIREVGFTVLGARRDESLIRLFLDGRLAAEQSFLPGGNADQAEGVFSASPARAFTDLSGYAVALHPEEVFQRWVDVASGRPTAADR